MAPAADDPKSSFDRAAALDAAANGRRLTGFETKRVVSNATSDSRQRQPLTISPLRREGLTGGKAIYGRRWIGVLQDRLACNRTFIFYSALLDGTETVMSQTPRSPGDRVIAGGRKAILPPARAIHVSPSRRPVPRRTAAAWRHVAWVGFEDEGDPARTTQPLASSEPPPLVQPRPQSSPRPTSPLRPASPAPAAPWPAPMPKAVRDQLAADDRGDDDHAGGLTAQPLSAVDFEVDLPISRAAASRSAGSRERPSELQHRPQTAANMPIRVRRLGPGLSRSLRLAVAAATIGAVAVVTYQGGERRASLTGERATTAAPVPPTMALAAPEPEPPPALAAEPAQGRANSTDDRRNTVSERAAYYLDEGARAGDVGAHDDLGVLSARRDGPSQDYADAVAPFRDAAAAGNPAAQFNLGVMYERGQSLVQAITWYRRAVEQNYPPAQYKLGALYSEGRGVSPDPRAAIDLYRQAALQGLVVAMVKLAILYNKGEGIERSASAAYAWYRAAARAGDQIAEQRARDLFQQLGREEQGWAVMAAEGVQGALREAAKQAKLQSSKPVGPARAVVGPKPSGAGRSVLEYAPAALVRLQPSG